MQKNVMKDRNGKKKAQKAACSDGPNETLQRQIVLDTWGFNSWLCPILLMTPEQLSFPYQWFSHLIKWRV